MKKAAILYALVFVLITFGPTAWAQTTVTTESELRTAIQVDGANITVTADIELSNSTLSIPTGNTVTIDLNGHTLDRKLKWRGEGGGQAITVRSGATLNLSNGTLKGGWGGNGGGIANEGGTANLTDVTITGCTGDDRGGAISNLSGGTLTMTGGSITNNTCYDHGDPAGGGGLFNAEGATATLTGVTITGNEDMVCGGGGICNYGTILLDGCTITGNKARTVGGGIWSGNEKHLLKMQGANIITDNIAAGVPSNLFMKERRLITLTGSITGSRIGIMLDVAPNQFTDGYATYHNGEDPNTFFTCDKPWVDSLAIIQPEPYVLYVGEVIMRRKNLKGKVPYIEHSWDSENNKVVSITKTLTEEIGLNDTPTSETQYKKLKSSNLFVTLGTENSELHEYYVAEGDELNIYALDVKGPNVHIILRDSAWLHLEEDIYVPGGNTVYFHAQSTGSFIGKLTSGEGIGGNPQDGGANIEIHGGNFDLQGAESCAAIGGKYETNGNITIYDGHIKATGGDAAAGIGSGYGCENYGNITIYGGKIEATGSAGIGGGQECLNGKLTIWDGAITARGQSEAAGIGGSQYGSDYAAGTITINGGYIRAYGATHGAGIGGGDGKRGGTLIVNGGRVDAYGGTDAAGIGGGEGGNGGIVTINGGYVYAEGNDYGAGIGGGEDGAGADVTITGGVVIAKAGGNEDHPCAIGRGSDADNSDGSLTFADNLGVFITTNLYRSVKQNRVSDCRNNQYVQINKCAHGGATYTDNGSSVNVGCTYCSTVTMPYTFNANGNWNEGSNWFCGYMPHEGNDVAVKADATIPSGCCAHVGGITIDGGTITIADGGQLIHNNAGVTATVQKAITGHGGDNNGGWNFIASPMVTTITPAATNGFLTDNYDLYYYDEPTHYWMNHKGSDHGHFDIEPQKGYLYASYDNTTLNMTGTLQSSNEPVTISGLSHEASALTGFNLVGNPFACNAAIDRPFYVIEGKHVVAYEGSDPIAPGTGVMVQADADHESVTFTKVTPEAQASRPNNGSLQIALAQANTRSNAKIDNAVVSFTEGSQLEKFHFGNDAKLYIPQDGKDYAIAFSETQGEMPLNFKATVDGTYTLTVSESLNSKFLTLNYLHLIDNLTGADIDLLVNPSYTYDARTTDYESRFKLVFSAIGDDDDENNAPFAYYANGEIIIFADAVDASLQVIDVLGRILLTQNLSYLYSHLSTLTFNPGVYVLQLINGNDIKTQKIIIK